MTDRQYMRIILKLIKYLKHVYESLNMLSYSELYHQQKHHTSNDDNDDIYL